MKESRNTPIKKPQCLNTNFVYQLRWFKLALKNLKVVLVFSIFIFISKSGFVAGFAG